MVHILDSKFKVGDIVVRTKQGFWGAGTKAKVIKTPTNRLPGDYQVRIVGEDLKTGWNVKNMELESVYNSPLYQALL